MEVFPGSRFQDGLMMMAMDGVGGDFCWAHPAVSLGTLF